MAPGQRPAPKPPSFPMLKLKQILLKTPKFLFFTGKGGVGKTSIASATSVALAHSGKRVLLISTDPASNLDEVLETKLSTQPVPVAKVPGLFALNLDPEAIASNYREKVIGPMRGILPETALAAMEEQLSGACTTEIASFDEFTSYLAAETSKLWDHLVFDTAPTGHTLRLMALSQAWTQYLDTNQSGNSCLGPLAGLDKQRQLYADAVRSLKDPQLTGLYLVSRPSQSPLVEAQRTSHELGELGIANQSLILNGWFQPEETYHHEIPVQSWLNRQNQAMNQNGTFLSSLPVYKVPLLPGNAIGTETLERLFEADPASPSLSAPSTSSHEFRELPSIATLAEEILPSKHGVILVMGKGGVGKTTVAAALAIALAEAGANVRLSTTDPAAHLRDALGNSQIPGLTVERIDPKAETSRYVDEVLAAQSPGLDPENLALLEEDLRSPCTEEIAVFRAFARTVAGGQGEFVVLDTAPTGHTLLLLDATQSYHRELNRQSRTAGYTTEVEMLLPRLRDPGFTRVLLVTLPESTPVHEASSLQEDLQRAGIESYGWVINQNLASIETTEPTLTSRRNLETRYVEEVLTMNPGKPVYTIPWSLTNPSGLQALRSLAEPFEVSMS